MSTPRRPLHFLINDVLMTLFFRLAVKEIAEAFQPGGSLYHRPASREPALWYGRGVPGPILAYFVMGLTSSGMIEEDFGPLSSAGIPTATDISIAWVSAVCVLVAGHSAINYLLFVPSSMMALD